MALSLGSVATRAELARPRKAPPAAAPLSSAPHGTAPRQDGPAYAARCATVRADSPCHLRRWGRRRPVMLTRAASQAGPPSAVPTEDMTKRVLVVLGLALAACGDSEDSGNDLGSANRLAAEKVAADGGEYCCFTNGSATVDSPEICHG